MRDNVVMIVGGEGFLGMTLCALLKHKAKLDFVCLSKHALNITDTFEVRRNIETYKPFAIVNCAAFTNVDRAEIERAEALSVNALGAQILAEEAARSGAFLIHISTDMVFDSSLEDRREDSLPAPVNWYGETKLQGEKALAEVKDLKYLIVRTAGLYDLKAERGFPVRMIEYIQSTGNPIRMSTKAIGCPTAVEDLTCVLYRILLEVEYGSVFFFKDHSLHAVGPSLSWIKMARMILSEVYRDEEHIDKFLIEVNIPPENPPPGRAVRASRLVLDCKRLWVWTGMELRAVGSSLRDGLGEALRERFLVRR